MDGRSGQMKNGRGIITMRPYVICHMTTSIDGKVTGSFLTREELGTQQRVAFQLDFLSIE